MKGELLTQADKADLRILLRVRDLRAHFKRASTTYQVWATSICATRIKDMNGRSDHTFNLPETVEQLTIIMRNYDSDLKILLANRKTQDEILSMPHERVCRLFAMHVLAGEPGL